MTDSWTEVRKIQKAMPLLLSLALERGKQDLQRDERGKFPLRHMLLQNEGVRRLRGVTSSPRYEN